MAIAKYEALKFLRSRKRLPQPLDEEVLEKMATEMSARYDVLEIRRRALEQCLEALREQDRHLVNIVYGANTPHSKLCVPLGMTSNQFYKTLNRIRHKLQKCIQFRLLAEARS
jgi:RNA polymerase sigma-70 factor (ECF subfamily)